MRTATAKLAGFFSARTSGVPAGSTDLAGRRRSHRLSYEPILVDHRQLWCR